MIGKVLDISSEGGLEKFLDLHHQWNDLLPEKLRPLAISNSELAAYWTRLDSQGKDMALFRVQDSLKRRRKEVRKKLW